jgi:hypothetical protein
MLLLFAAFSLLEELGALLEGVLEAALGDEQHVVLQHFLARLALLDLLDAFCVLVLRVGLDAAGGGEGYEVVVALQLADLDVVAQAVQGGGLDLDRLVEARVLGVLRQDVGELERAEHV